MESLRHELHKQKLTSEKEMIGLQVRHPTGALQPLPTTTSFPHRKGESSPLHAHAGRLVSQGGALVSVWRSQSGTVQRLPAEALLATTGRRARAFEATGWMVT